MSHRSDRKPVQPVDVVDAAEFVTGTLASSVGMDWSVRAGRLAWTVEQTLAHMLAPAKYALYLAARSTHFMAAGIEPWTDATQAERLDALLGAARSLAGVATWVPPRSRGFHVRAMADAEGFVALGCLELVVHGYDAAQGLDLPYEPSDSLCARLLARLFPWAEPSVGSAWPTLLRTTGRGESREGTDDSWVCHVAPLDEWDGSIPTPDPHPVVEWVSDHGGSWSPVYLT